MTTLPVYQCATIPVDNKKRSLVQWKEYQNRLPTVEEVTKWKVLYGSKIAGWAMPTGLASGIIALDFDGDLGVKTLKELGLKANVKTAGDGYHVWLDAPDYPVRTGAKDSRWPGMELKGDGGYVVVIGDNIISAHVGEESKQGSYALLDETPTSKDDLLKALADFAYQAKEQDGDYALARHVAEALEMCESEGRNAAGFWLSCQLRDAGLSKPEAWAILNTAFYPQTPRGEHPYTKKELKDSLDSAYSKAPNKNLASSSALELVNKAALELWHTEENDPYITLDTGDNVPVGSMRTREFVNALYFRQFHKPLNKTALEEVIDTLKWSANYDGQQYGISLRIAYKNGTLHIDTEQVEGVKFLRTKSMGMLPKPVKDVKGLERLRKYVNVRPEDYVLVEGLILSHFMPDGPYPVGAFIGPQGSAKSTSQSFVLAVTDPRPTIEAGRYRLPRNDNDLVIVAKQNRILSFDNVSAIPEWLSDAFCTLSTGGNMLRRKLYTDDEMLSYGQKKPILINGIGDIVTRPDLLDRAIVLECPLLDGYKSERLLYAEFTEDLPYILGGAMSLAQKAMDNIDHVTVDDSVRMADFLAWCKAAELEGFEEAFIDNRNRGAQIAIENSAVGRFVKAVADKHKDIPVDMDMISRLRLADNSVAKGRWIGPLHKLYEMGELTATGAYDWPKKFESFVNQLYRVEPMLNRLGIYIDRHKTELMEICFVGYRND